MTKTNYVFDTNVFILFFSSYYPDSFPTLWKQFNQLVANGQITSTREVMRELEVQGNETLQDWLNTTKELFPAPTANEAQFVTEIYAMTHFQQNIERKKLLKGGNVADSFVIARAKILSATVVTLERERPNSAKIPNICQHFKIPCVSLERFMKLENWSF